MPKSLYEKKTKQLFKKFLSKGYSIDALKNSFIKAGYKQEEIDKVLSDIKVRKESSRKFGLTLLIIFIPILIVLVFLALKPSSNCGNDLECFTNLANECKQASSYFMVSGNKISLEADKCQLTKKIIEFDAKEPPELVALLKNKSMLCTYENSSFDPSLLTLTGSIDKCEGDLKDAFLDIRLAQLELEAQP